jgi:hypothetical protein
MKQKLKILSALMMFLILLPLLTTLPSCSQKSEGITDNDTVQIYAAVIRQIYTIDHTFGIGNSPNFPVIYLPRGTDDSIGYPGSSRGRSIGITELVQAKIVKALKDLPAKFIWFDYRSEVPMENDGVAGGGAIIYYGNIWLQGDGSVQVSGGISIASLGGSSTTYVLEQINGIWTITGRTGESWIS